MPTISVIVPVYNVERYLERCVNSILSQTFEDFELILVDDGSPDRSGVMCDEYAEKDTRITVIHQENQGQASARNHGVEIAKGEWISFVDSDDYIHPQMLEVLYDGIIRYNAKIVMCSIQEIFTDALPTLHMVQTQCTEMPAMSESTLKDLIESGGTRYWIPCAKLIYREILLKHPFPEGRIYEDNAVVCKWLYDAYQLADCKESLYYYYRNPAGTTRSLFTEKRLDYLWALEQQLVFYKKLHFKTMFSIIGCEYARYVTLFHKKVTAELKRTDLAKSIRQNFNKWEKDIKRLPLSEYERECLYVQLYPIRFKWNRLLCRARALFKK